MEIRGGAISAKKNPLEEEAKKGGGVLGRKKA